MQPDHGLLWSYRTWWPEWRISMSILGTDRAQTRLTRLRAEACFGHVRSARDARQPAPPLDS